RDGRRKNRPGLLSHCTRNAKDQHEAVVVTDEGKPACASGAAGWVCAIAGAGAATGAAAREIGAVGGHCRARRREGAERQPGEGSHAAGPTRPALSTIDAMNGVLASV